jgi:hypothetical protein
MSGAGSLCTYNAALACFDITFYVLFQSGCTSGGARRQGGAAPSTCWQQGDWPGLCQNGDNSPMMFSLTSFNNPGDAEPWL